MRESLMMAMRVWVGLLVVMGVAFPSVLGEEEKPGAKVEQKGDEGVLWKKSCGACSLSVVAWEWRVGEKQELYFRMRGEKATSTYYKSSGEVLGVLTEGLAAGADDDWKGGAHGRMTLKFAKDAITVVGDDEEGKMEVVLTRREALEMVRAMNGFYSGLMGESFVRREKGGSEGEDRGEKPATGVLWEKKSGSVSFLVKVWEKGSRWKGEKPELYFIWDKGGGAYTTCYNSSGEMLGVLTEGLAAGTVDGVMRFSSNDKVRVEFAKEWIALTIRETEVRLTRKEALEMVRVMNGYYFGLMEKLGDLK